MRAPRDGNKIGCSGSPLLNGTLDLHVRLSRNPACFLGKPAAVVPTGYQSNLAAISAMRIRGHDHPRRAGTTAAWPTPPGCPADYLYRHNDMDHLALGATPHRGAPLIIVVDAVFSMEGTVADPATIADLPTGTAAGSMGRVPCAGRARPRRARSFGRVGCLGAHGRRWARSTNPYLRRRASSPEIGPSWDCTAQRFRSCSFPARRRPPRLPPTRLARQSA